MKPALARVSFIQGDAALPRLGSSNVAEAGAGGRNRTGTVLPPADFESDAKMPKKRFRSTI